MYDVLIIGCGVVGAATAFQLSKYQLKTAVLERENDVAMGTTKANSAILHAGYDPRPGTLMAKLNVRGAALAAELCSALDVPREQVGSLVLALSEEDLPKIQELYRRGIANGVPGVQLLSGEEAKAMEPNLAPEVCGALYAPTAAICSPWELCLALAETAVRNGVELHLETAVQGMQQTENGWTVQTNQGDFQAKYVINAAGTDAAAVHDMAAPHAFDIAPSSGQYWLLDKSEGDRVSHVIFQVPSAAGKGVLVAPTVHGNLIVGPDARATGPHDTSVTAAGLAYVQSCARRSVPSIDFRANIRNFAGVRAKSGEDFILQWADDVRGFLDLAGTASPGLTAATAIGEYAVELLQQDGLALQPKENFICARHRVRFKELPPEDRAALVQGNPAYGKVICRCETVTEGEILDALHGPIPPRSLDGVKRRTNAGMGRCQGGFCGPRVAELLHRELGIPLGEVLQDQAGSWLLRRETKGGAAHV